LTVLASLLNALRVLLRLDKFWRKPIWCLPHATQSSGDRVETLVSSPHECVTAYPSARFAV
jgi:hypothetical protein